MTDAPASAPAAVATLHARTRHRVAAVRVRGALPVRVWRGRKRPIGTVGEVTASAGELCAVAPGTDWDVVNDPAPDAAYEALVLELDPSALAAFESSGATAPDASIRCLAAALELTSPDLDDGATLGEA